MHTTDRLRGGPDVRAVLVGMLRGLNLYGHLFPSLDVELAARLEHVGADALTARLRHADAPEVVDIETARR